MKQVFNLNEQITKVIELYENLDRVKISFDQGDGGRTWSTLTGEQLSRALINLIKNGIQAIPDDRPGTITIIAVKKRAPGPSLGSRQWHGYSRRTPRENVQPQLHDQIQRDGPGPGYREKHR